MWQNFEKNATEIVLYWLNWENEGLFFNKGYLLKEVRKQDVIYMYNSSICYFTISNDGNYKPLGGRE